MAQVQRPERMPAIFVHAGAGSHSIENERAHLELCAKATQAGMAFLRRGGSAVEAVEVALTVFEDSPMTNAGYGSNLTKDGHVECDASVVDHFGRSGAVGAAPNIKNPIAVARKVHERAHLTSNITQVPPNLLVAGGATDFAWEHGLPVVSEDLLISPGARERWVGWCKEIIDFNASHPEIANGTSPWFRTPYQSPASRLGCTAESSQSSSETMMSANSQPATESDIFGGSEMPTPNLFDGHPVREMGWTRPPGGISTPFDHSASPTLNSPMQDSDNANITDTVGAIAIDMKGCIAAGSSSGGIGMKHRGRVGPAALIGIGTHVLPALYSDPTGTTVAAVCSGTGEQIATTFAANTCATRLFDCQRKREDGSYEDVPEDQAMHDFIEREFVMHSSVTSSEVDGSIGILAVKKTLDSICLYFAHNTKSFAIAGMTGNDRLPFCLMSRSQGNRSIAQGGRMFRPVGWAPTMNVNMNMNGNPNTTGTRGMNGTMSDNNPNNHPADRHEW